MNDAGSSAGGSRITGRIRAECPDRKGADAGRVSLWGLDDRGRRNRRGKLDATTVLDTTEVAAATAMVNGPEDEPLDWDTVSWRRAEENVRRLRQRIFAASRAGDLKRVRSLQKLMLRSRGERAGRGAASD